MVASNACQVPDSKVAAFYKGKRVLISGATGFLGKVILWKLFVSCKDIDKIYLLIRSKRNQTCSERLTAMLKAKPFSSLHSSIGLDTMLAKTVAIDADLTAPGLGLSEENRALLETETNIVIHSAASVKFDAPLIENYRDNVLGVRSILELCDKMQDLDCLVHVSTAYSNCHLDDIYERLHPLKEDAEKLCNLIEQTPAEELDKMNHLLEGRPNTYTYTKAIAEQLVAKREGKYPISIVRPSIVISSVQEPSEGFVDNVNGIAGLGALASIGLLRTIDWDYYATSDMVPVDYVANCIICTARYTKINSPTNLTVFNMTSGNLNPVSWGQFFCYARDAAQATPPNKSVRPMIASPKYHRVSKANLVLTKIFSELLFAYVIDTILLLLGHKQCLVRITKRMHHGYKILKPFTIRQWNFDSKNVLDLSSSLNVYDKQQFPFDLRDIDWRQQALSVWKGTRSELLKDEESKSSYASGRKKQIYVTLAHYIMTSMFFGLIGYTMMRLVV